MTDFGDRVRIKESPETQAAGIAGLEGDIYGVTTPSITSVEVIGGAPDDCALNVSFEGRSDTFWIRPDLVEMLHHNAGMEMVVGNVKAVRQPDGSWVESVIRPSEPAKGQESLWSRIASFFKK
ncbi:MAG: hypothetical protein ACOYXR_09190 [Nitrospirota bacterium]